MATKWDCLFALFELKAARLSDLAARSGASPSSTSQRLAELLREGLILKEKRIYMPNRPQGRTWQAFEDLSFSNIQRVEFDPADDNVIYVTTFGGGVWRGPAVP